MCVCIMYILLVIVYNMTTGSQTRDLSEAGLSWVCITCRSILRLSILIKTLDFLYIDALDPLINHSLILLPKHYPSYPPPLTHPIYPLSKLSPLAQYPLLLPHLTPHSLYSLLTHIGS